MVTLSRIEGSWRFVVLLDRSQFHGGCLRGRPQFLGIAESKGNFLLQMSDKGEQRGGNRNMQSGISLLGNRVMVGDDFHLQLHLGVVNQSAAVGFRTPGSSPSCSGARLVLLLAALPR